MSKETEDRGQLLFTICVPDFITRVKTAESRKAVYFEKDNKKTPIPISKQKHIPLKYDFAMHKIGSKWKNLLYEKSTGNLVVKNSRTAGMEKFLPIKGNLFYSGFSHYSQRNLVINAIKDNFKKYFNIKPVTDYPIMLEFIMYDVIVLKQGAGGLDKSQDIDNKFFAYVKSSLDLMTKEKIIKDDNLAFIRKVSYEYVDSKERKLIIKAWKYVQSTS